MRNKETEYNTAYQFFRRTGDETRLNAVREKYGMGVEDRKSNKERDKRIKKMRETKTLRAVAQEFGLSEGRVFQICGKTGRLFRGGPTHPPTQTISVYLGFEIVEKFRAMSKKKNLSVSKILTPAILDFLRKEEAEAKTCLDKYKKEIKEARMRELYPK